MMKLPSKEYSTKVRTCYVVGNGPSLELRVFDFLAGKTWIGMNSAFRHWDSIDSYPKYYACLDPVVANSNSKEVARLIASSPIQHFFLHDSIRPDIEAAPEGKEITFLSEFISLSDVGLNMSPKSRDKQTTGSLACRYMIWKGYNRLYLYGIDCNYQNYLPETKVEEGLTLSIAKGTSQNPNYYFGAYQQQGDKYQVPNPAEHSGNLHLQSFVALREDIARADAQLDVYVSSTDSLLYTHGLFKYFDPSTETHRKLQCIAVPLTTAEIPQLIENLKQWSDPTLLPSLGTKRGTVLHLFFDTTLDSAAMQELHDKIAAVGIDRSQIDEIRITSLDLPQSINYYVRPNQVTTKRCHKSGPNISFLALLEACKCYEYTLLMETDCAPLRAGWLDSLDAEIQASPSAWIIGSAYLGPTRLGDSNRLHLNGNAIYRTGSRGFQDFIFETFVPLLKHFIYEGAEFLAYDCLIAHAFHHFSLTPIRFRSGLLEALPHIKYSNLIVNYGGIEETIDDSILEKRKVFNGRAVVAHGRGPLVLQRQTLGSIDQLFNHQANLPAYDLPLLSIWSGIDGFRLSRNEGHGKIHAFIPASDSPGQIAIHFTCPPEPKFWRIAFSADFLDIPSRVSEVDFRLITEDNSQNGRQTIETIALSSVHRGDRLQWLSPVQHTPLGGRLIQVLLRVSSGAGCEFRTASLRAQLLAVSNQGSAQVKAHACELENVVSNWTQFIEDIESQRPSESPYSDVSKPELRRSVPASIKQEVPNNCTALLLGGYIKLHETTGEFRIKPWPKAPYAAFCFETPASRGKKISVGMTVWSSTPCELRICLCRDGASDFEESAVNFFCDSERRVVRVEWTPNGQHSGFRLQIALLSQHIRDDVRLKVSAISFDIPSISALTNFGKNSGYLLSINPDLVDGFGHYLQMDRQLHKASQERCWEFRSLAHASSIQPTPWVVPAFTRKTFELPHASLLDWRAVLSTQPAQALASEIVHAVDRYRDAKRPVIVYSYMSSALVVSAIILAARQLDSPPSRFGGVLFVICLSTMLLQRDDFRAISETNVLEDMSEGLRGGIAFTSDDELTIGYGSRHNGKVLRVPMFPLLDNYTPSRPEWNNNRRLHVVYASNSQKSKGYEVLVRFLVEYASTLASDFTFTVRFYARDNLLDYEAFKLKLSSLENVNVVEGALTDSQYHDLICSADILLVPYLPSSFSRRTSAQIVDAVMCGTPAVASAGSWAGGVVEAFGCGTTFETDNPTSLLFALRRIRGSYSRFRVRTEEAKAAWTKLYTAADFIEKMTSIYEEASLKNAGEPASKNIPPTLRGANQLFRNGDIEDALLMYETLRRSADPSIADICSNNIRLCNSRLRISTPKGI